MLTWCACIQKNSVFSVTKEVDNSSQESSTFTPGGIEAGTVLMSQEQSREKVATEGYRGRSDECRFVGAD